jgi:hypothetical protein
MLDRCSGGDFYKSIAKGAVGKMKRTTATIMGLAALVVMLALSAFSAGAAQASLFLWTGSLPALLLALAQGQQKFQLFAGGPIITCKHAHFHGTITEERSEKQVVIGEYLTCEAFGSKVKVSPAEYELKANETVKVLKPITIEAALLCKVVVLTTGNENLSRIRYLKDILSTELPRLLLHAEVENITSDTTNLGGGEALCGTPGEHKTGIYRGLLLVWAHGAGALLWHA